MSNYTEDQTLELEATENGVVTIGDLFDCNQTTSVGYNLFGPLKEEHIAAYPLQSSDFDLKQVKSFHDKVKTLGFSVEFEFPILGGFIMVTGGVGFNSSDGKILGQDEIICTYKKDSFSVRALKEIENNIDEGIKNKILSGAIKATHVVTEVITGARLNATIKINDNGPKKRFYFKGGIKGTASLVIASASIGVSVWVDDTSNGLETITNITVNATPPIKTQPKNMAELMKMINKFNSDDEKPFKIIKDMNITGVPIKFKAVPVQTFLRSSKHEVIPVVRVYKVIDDDLRESLLRMFATLKDIQVYEYIKERVLERDPRLKNILIDSENALTKMITERENHFKTLSVKFQARAYVCMFDYKLGLKDTTALEQLLVDFEEEFDLCRIHSDVLSYAAEGRQQLLGVKSFDFIEDKNDVTFFTNHQDLQDWLVVSSNMKIILQTRTAPQVSHESSGAILALFDLSKPLKELGITSGILYPNISQEFSLQFLLHGESIETSKKFTGAEVAFALKVLRTAIGAGEPVETIFFNVYSAMNNIRLPLKVETLRDITSLISTTKNLGHVKICESFLQTREIISKDSKWKFVMTTDVADTVVEATTCFKRLQSYLEANMGSLEYDLIVGTFGSHVRQDNFSEAPVLFLFKTNTLMAVCMDNLDIQILLDDLLTGRSDQEKGFGSLSVEQLSPICLYPERSRFVVAVSGLWGNFRSAGIEFTPGSFAINVNAVVPLTIELIRAAVSGDYRQIANAGAKICLTYYYNKQAFPDILNILRKNKWDEVNNEFLIDPDFYEDWKTLETDLYNYNSSNDPFLSKLDFAITTLEEFVADKESYEQINDIIGDPECPLELRVELERILEYQYTSEDSRLQDLINILAEFVAKFQAQSLYTNVRGEVVEDVIAKYKTILLKLKDVVSDLKRRLFSILQSNPEHVINDILSSDDSAYEEMESVRKEMQAYENVEVLEVKIKGVLKIFEACKGRITSRPHYQHLAAFREFVDKLSMEPPTTAFLSDLITRYILALNDQLYPGSWQRAVSYVKRQSFYQAIYILKKSVVHPALNTFFQNLDMLSGVPDEDILIRILEGFGDYKLTDENYQDLWDNPKFLFLMRHGLRYPNVLNTIKQLQCQSENDIHMNFIPRFIPPEFAQEIKALVVSDSITFEWKRIWNDLFDFMKVLQIFMIRGKVPADFQRAFWDNIERNSALKNKLIEIDVLYHWNVNLECFEEPWDVDTVNRAINTIQEWLTRHKNATEVVPLDIVIQREEERDISEEVHSEYIELDFAWEKLTGGSLRVLEKANILQFIETIEKPRVSDQEMTSFMSQVIPYVLQQLQLLDPAALTPQRISECVEKLRDQFELDRPGNIKLDFDEEDEENPPISRLDVLTCIMTAMETHTAIWFLKTLARFPSPLPLIIPNITFNPTSKYNCLLPWLKQLPSGNNSSLFTEPYRLIVCVRIGDNNTRGKSQILNSILKPSNVFSSKNEPGSNTGKPISLPGFVEFLELSEFSCESSIWEKLNDENPSGRPILLANVHGDILRYRETLSLLAKIASCFLTFHMPASWEAIKTSTKLFKTIIEYPKSKLTLHVLVDPLEDVADQVKPSDIIYTADIPNSEIITEKMKNLLLSSMMFQPVVDKGVNMTYYESIEMVEKVESSLSAKIIQNCLDNSCKLVKDSLVLQEQRTLTVPDFNRIWQDNSDLREVVAIFASILQLPASRRRIAYTHMSQQLSQLGFGETQILRKISALLLELLEKELGADKLNYNQERVTNLQRHLREVYIRQQNSRMITVQDIFNEMLTIYDMAISADYNESTVVHWPQMYSEFFNDGNTIEIGGEKFTAWIDPFLKHLNEKYADSKIFTVSILGAENSGKSRLLNDLFGTTFVTRPSSKTNGINISLIHLQETVKAQLQCEADAVLVIDTEGLSPLETTGDIKEETVQRELVAKVLCLSQLVIFNVNGKERGSFRSIRKLVELPLVGAMRIGGHNFLENIWPADVTKMKKEILMVHHSDENEIYSLEKNLAELLLTFEMVDTFSHENVIELGQNQRLQNIIQRNVETVEVSYLSSLQNVSSHDEINKIREKFADILQKTEDSPKLVEWFHSVRVVQEWFSGLNTSFPCNLNSIADLKMYTEIRVGLMNECKTAVDAALESHRIILEADIKEIIDSGKDFEFLFEKTDRVLNSCDLLGEDKSLIRSPCLLCKTAMILTSKVEIAAKQINDPLSIEKSIRIYIKMKCDNVKQMIFQKIASADLKRGIPWKFQLEIMEKMKQLISELVYEMDSEDISIIIDKSWVLLQQLVSLQITMVSLVRLLVAEIGEEYKYSHHLVLPSVWRTQKALKDAVVTLDKPQFSSDWEQDQWLHSQLQDMKTIIFQQNDTNYFRVGMIRNLKERIDDIVAQFEYRSKRELEPEESWKVHARGLVLFYEQTMNDQILWNKECDNNPLSRLLQNQEYYLQELQRLFNHVNSGSPRL